MTVEQKRKSLALVIPGLTLQIGCMGLSRIQAFKIGDHSTLTPEWMAHSWAIGSLSGVLLLIIGARYYAKAKGYNPAMGLLGLLSCLGLLILAVLPDKFKNQSS